MQVGNAQYLKVSTTQMGNAKYLKGPIMQVMNIRRFHYAKNNDEYLEVPVQLPEHYLEASMQMEKNIYRGSNAIREKNLKVCRISRMRGWII
jgi:hypothetical protein